MIHDIEESGAQTDPRNTPINPRDVLECNVNALVTLCAAVLPLYRLRTRVDLDRLEEPSATLSAEFALDAWAEVTISDPTNSFATAFRLYPNQKIRLLLASKNPITHHTVKHLRDTWMRLNSLHHASHTPNHPTDPFELRMEIGCRLNAYSHQLVLKRFNKWLPVLRDVSVKQNWKNAVRRVFARRYKGKAFKPPFQTDKPQLLAEQFDYLLSELVVCQMYLQELPRGAAMYQVIPVSCRTFFSKMEKIAKIGSNILSKFYVCETWAAQMDLNGIILCSSTRRFRIYCFLTDPPRIRQAIKKLCAFQCYVDFLLSTATRNGTNMFVHDFDVVVVPRCYTTEKFITNWPKHREDWMAFRDSVCYTHCRPLVSPEYEDCLLNTLPTVTDGFLHPECALIQYIVRRQEAGVQTREYIGLSSRPCHSCTEWIRNVNRHRMVRYHEQPFTHRQSSGKIKADWALPAYQERHLGGRLLYEYGYTFVRNRKLDPTIAGKEEQAQRAIEVEQRKRELAAKIRRIGLN